MNLRELIAEVVDHLRGMWRYRWWGLALAWLISIGGSLYVYTMPDQYRASARVYVDTESLLRPLMQGLTATQSNMNELQLLSRVVLTRPNLEKVAYATDLDLRVRTPEEMEALISRLQDRIAVSGGRDNVFSVQYDDPSREKARDVVAAIVDNFVEGGLDTRIDDTELSERAVANELEIHERRLREKEEQLARFKQENVGYMPGENGDYYNRLQAALSRLGEIERALQLATDRRDELRRQIRGEDPVIGIMPSTGPAGSNCSQSGTLAALQSQLDILEVQYTNKHPRYTSIEERIAYLEDECHAELEASGAAGLGITSAASLLDANPVYQNLRIQASDAEVQIVGLNAQLTAQQAAVAQLRQDVDKITQVETELRQMTRDYDVIQNRHQELLRRWEDLQAKMRLDPVSDGVQFRVIEPPFAQADPVGPNRPLLIGAALVLALGASGALAFLLNQINPVFFTGAKLRHAIEYPVIGSITMILPANVVAKRRMEAVTWGAACLLLLAATGVAILVAPWAGPLLRGMV